MGKRKVKKEKRKRLSLLSIAYGERISAPTRGIAV